MDKKIRNVELNAPLTIMMDKYLDLQEFRNVIISLVQAVTKGKEPALSKEEMSWFEQLNEEAQTRAEAWMGYSNKIDKRKYSSPENGKKGGRPKKRVEPSPEDLIPTTLENF